jgi:hypothetical protein
VRSIESLLATKEIVVFCGSGGVGKTSVAASAGVAAAARMDGKVLVVTVDPAFVSTAEAIGFPTEGGLTAHAFFYARANRDHRGPDGERPPLIVISHGGPTGFAELAGSRNHIRMVVSKAFVSPSDISSAMMPNRPARAAMTSSPA